LSSPKAMWDEMVALEKTVLFSIADKQQLTEHLQGAVPKVNEAGGNIYNLPIGSIKNNMIS
jgi:hypothetical protein